MMGGCGCGPWITLSMCGAGKFDARSDVLVEVTCPSRFCMTWVRLIEGKIPRHDNQLYGGGCAFAGVRVVDDRADFAPERMTTVHPVADKGRGRDTESGDTGDRQR